jgi:hypothetical protein
VHGLRFFVDCATCSVAASAPDLPARSRDCVRIEETTSWVEPSADIGYRGAGRREPIGYRGGSKAV